MNAQHHSNSCNEGWETSVSHSVPKDIGWYRDSIISHIKFLQISVFSGFNQPDDISMNRRYESLCGITQDELDISAKQDPMECERYFQYTFYLMVKMLAFYSTVAEKETSEGRIDCVVECPGYVYIIEFKLNDSAEAALRQIEEKGYAKPYAADSRKLSFSSSN